MELGDDDLETPLVGRSVELRALERHVAGVASGAGSFLAVTGEPGIGKTRLLQRAAIVARARDVHVLATRGVELGGLAPYETVAAALDPWLAALPEWRLRQLGGERQAALAGALRAFGNRAAPGAVLETERWRCHRAIRDLLARLGDDEPVLLLLDDVHGADTATIELLAHLLRRPPLRGVMVAIAYRARRAPTLLRRAVESAAFEGTLDVHELAPLTEQDVRELLGSAVDDETARALHAQSEGNPLLLEQLKHGAPRSSEAVARLARELPLPEPISDRIAADLTALDVSSHRLLSAGAVLGDEFAVDAAAQVAGLTEDMGLAAFDVLAGRELVRPGGAAREAVFHHPLLRRAVYEMIDPRERRDLHRRAVHVLAGRASPWAVAHHVERSATRGDRAAVERLVEAGRASAASAPADAAAWFARARELIAPDAPPEQRMTVLVPLARAQAMTGRFEDSRATLAEALTLAEGPLARMRIAIVTVLGQLGVLIGLPAAGRRLLREELARAAGRSTPDVCALRLALATNHLILEEVDPATEAAGEALALARRLGDEASVFAATALLAFGHYQRGAVARAQALCAAAVAGFESLPDGRLVQHLDAVSLLGHTLYAIDRLGEASQVLERGLTIARTAGAVAWFEPLLAALANARLWQGRLVEGAELADEALEASAVTGNAHARLWALTIRAWIAAERGDLGIALESSQDAVALARNTPLAMFRWAAVVVHATALLERGRASACRAAILGACGPELSSIPRSFRTRWFALLARAELGLGDPAGAGHWVRRAEVSAAPLSLASRTADAKHARAALLLQTGVPRRAAELADEAGRLHLQAGLLVDAARDNLLAGEALVSAGDNQAALPHFQTAHALAVDTGAMRVRRSAERALAQGGARPTVPPVPGSTRLTPRERKIATLVADGLSNREIAAELHLSARTIERHVTAVRRKLAAPSRAALASAVTRDRARFQEE